MNGLTVTMDWMERWVGGWLGRATWGAGSLGAAAVAAGDGRREGP